MILGPRSCTQPPPSSPTSSRYPLAVPSHHGTPRSLRSLLDPSLRRRQPLRYPRQARHHNAKGHTTCPTYSWKLGRSDLTSSILAGSFMEQIWECGDGMTKALGRQLMIMVLLLGLIWEWTARILCREVAVFRSDGCLQGSKQAGRRAKSMVLVDLQLNLEICVTFGRRKYQWYSNAKTSDIHVDCRGSTWELIQLC